MYGERLGGDSIEWILVDRGDVFEGTPEQFVDCFGSEPGYRLTVAGLAEWADLNGFVVEVQVKS